MSNTNSRRDFITNGAAAGGVCLLTFTLSGCEAKLTPAQARADRVPLHTLTDDDVTTLDALGETLLPGSAAAGLAQYLDHQLSGEAAHSMLMIKYLGVPAPFDRFYQTGLRAAETAARTLYGKTLADLSSQQAGNLVTQMSAGHVNGWQGPPPALFYFVLRNDAVDVMYGTQRGFALLDVPYMAHIVPPSRWGE
jgi:hypothetical protein